MSPLTDGAVGPSGWLLTGTLIRGYYLIKRPTAQMPMLYTTHRHRQIQYLTKNKKYILQEKENNFSQKIINYIGQMQLKLRNQPRA